MKVEPRASTGVVRATAVQASATTQRQEPQMQAELAAEVTRVLADMTYEERVSAYRSGALSAHELAVAAALLPKEVPLLNDEYEWIAVDAE
jgi:hypothetical protein